VTYVVSLPAVERNFTIGLSSLRAMPPLLVNDIHSRSG
jgi:hypothetical protein